MYVASLDHGEYSQLACAAPSVGLSYVNGVMTTSDRIGHRPWWPHRPTKSGRAIKLQFHFNFLLDEYGIGILGGRYLTLFDQRKYACSCHRRGLNFSLLRRGCSLNPCSLPLVHLITGGAGAVSYGYITVCGPRLFRRLDDTKAGVVEPETSGFEQILITVSKHVRLLGVTSHDLVGS